MRTFRTLGLALAVLASPARADFFNHRNFLVGERASVLGGAFTAVADDASALWYNPAGLSIIEKPSVSISANAYGMLLYRRTELLDEASGATADTTLQQITAVPTTLGFAIAPRKGLTLAFGVFITDKVRFVGTQERQDVAFTFPVNGAPVAFTRYVQRINFDALTTVLGPGVGWNLGRRLSVGASLLLQISALAFSTARDFVDASGAQLSLTSNVSGSSFGLLPCLAAARAGDGGPELDVADHFAGRVDAVLLLGGVLDRGDGSRHGHGPGRLALPASLLAGPGVAAEAGPHPEWRRRSLRGPQLSGGVRALQPHHLGRRAPGTAARGRLAGRGSAAVRVHRAAAGGLHQHLERPGRGGARARQHVRRLGRPRLPHRRFHHLGGGGDAVRALRLSGQRRRARLSALAGSLQRAAHRGRQLPLLRRGLREADHEGGARPLAAGS